MCYTNRFIEKTHTKTTPFLYIYVIVGVLIGLK